MIFDKIFKNSNGEYVNIFDILLGSGNFENYIYTLAEAHAIDLIAKTISKCEIQTFELIDKKIQKNKGDLYWTLNLQPNFNESGTAFIYKLITKLLTDKTALVLINRMYKRNLLYVADEYKASDDILYGKSFKNIILADSEGNTYPLNKTYKSNDTIYFTLSNKNLSVASESFKTNSGKILKAAQKSFINGNTSKWRLKNPGGQATMMDAETKKEISYTDYKNKLTDGLFSEEDSIILLAEIFDLINLNKDVKKEISDYENIITRIGNTVAQKWNIPLDVFYGNKTEKSTGSNDFITFAVDPYFEILEDGFNISLVGKESFIKGEYIKFNRLNIGYKDLIDKSSGWDKLISSGFSFNQLCELLGLPTINEEWADQHYITKNYANAKGGAENEE